MDAFLDKIWFGIMDLVALAVKGLNYLFSPLDALGPTGAVFCIAVVTLLIIKFLGPRVNTKRHKKLEADFVKWKELREEAMQWDDRERANRLARNIDQAGLNRVYYDYFFESLMLSMVGKYLPFLIMLGYVGNAYDKANLKSRFGVDYLFRLGTGPDSHTVGAVFWFVVSFLILVLAWSLVSRQLKKRRGAGSAA